MAPVGKICTLGWRRFNGAQKRAVAAAMVVSLAGVAFSAHALGPDGPAMARPARLSGYEAEDHFPGSAYYTAVSDDSAAAAGTTGTAALPDEPVPAGAVIDTSIQPAAPFRLAGTEIDRARAAQCLTTAIYYEAASEPDDGQRAVAQVVLNRVRHPAFPATVCGVVFQGSERSGCQFSFACDGAMARTPSRAAWTRASRVASAALAGSVFAPVGTATHYHTYAVTPSWNRSLVMTGVYGAHFFHRWKGWWGTAAAFRQVYQGGEPLPGPHARPAEPVERIPPILPSQPPVVAAQPQAAPAPLPAVQPRYGDSGTAIAGAALPESQILDKWKDSGKLLR